MDVRGGYAFGEELEFIGEMEGPISSRDPQEVPAVEVQMIIQ